MDRPDTVDLDELVRRFRSPLAGYCAARGLDPEAADRVAHEVFVTAWRARARFRGAFDDRAAIGAWLRGIAQNLLRAALRERRRGTGLADEPTAPRHLEPSALASEAATVARVRDAVRSLPPHEREVIWMFYFDDAATREVAAVLGITEKAVENRLRRGRETLRRRLATLAPHASSAATTANPTQKRRP